MSTRLALFFDRVVEGGWLAALVVAPLFFNLLSARTFEPDKAALVRAIVFVMLAAWVAASVLTPRPTDAAARPGPVLPRPLVWIVAALGIIVFLSAVQGLNSRVSLVGSYNRDQGVVTLIAYLALFVLAAVWLRTNDQLQRLLDTVVLTSLPVAVYAGLQRIGADPVPWGGFGAAVTDRVIGTQGNATFLGGYLALAIIPTLYLLLRARAEHKTARLAVYAVALAFQIIGLLLSDSRGAALGLAAGLVVWGLARAAADGHRRLAGIVVGLGVAGAVLVLAINLAGGALGGVPIFGRLARLSDPTAGSNQVRIYVWEGLSDMVAARPERWPLGVGPDALYLGYYPYFVPALRQIDNPLVGSHDRSHNEPLDRLATTGVLGLIAWLAAVEGLFFYAARWLGLADDRSRRTSLIGFLVAGPLLGGLIPLAADRSLRFVGLGIGIGVVLALIAWLAWQAMRRRDSAPQSELPAARVAVIAALLGVLVAHLVEIQVGIPVTATQVMFWLLAGVMVSVGVGRLDADESVPATETAATTGAAASTGKERGGSKSLRDRRAPRASSAAAQRKSAWPAPALSLGFVAGLILMTLTYDLIVRGLDLGSVLVILLILAIVTLAAGAFLSGGAGAFLAAALGVWVLYGVFHLILSIGGPNVALASYTVFVLALVLWLVGFGGVWAYGAPRVTGERAPAGRIALAAVAGLLALAGVWVLTLQPTYADIYTRLGSLYGQVGRWDLAADAYEQAVRHAPGQDFLYPNLAQAYLAQAQSAQDATLRTDLFEKARGALNQARGLSPRTPDYLINLGDAEQYYAAKYASDTERKGVQQQAAGHYELAAQLAPRDPHVLRKWAKLDLDAGNPTEAAKLLEQGLPLLLPDNATSVVPDTLKIAADMHADLARAYAALGRTADAVAQAQKALALAPADAKPGIEDLLKKLGGGA
ncbi:MAG: O-antigen ligase family protein [Anaerolineae bacterium]